ncbi:hypothetical protein SDC9_155677 [bioreactor metagenome]|uniref:Uncharacterized protein n=1 Tax=bioreactor metagenome TaxID=1076179 RepID=A0A645F263_9ZZZZ
MVGQATKWLGTDDIAIAAFDQLDHLGGEQPALTHFIAVADNVFDERFKVMIGRWRRKLRVLRQHFQHDVLHAQQKIHKPADNKIFDVVAAVKLVVLQTIIDFKQHKVQQTGQHDLAVL